MKMSVIILFAFVLIPLFSASAQPSYNYVRKYDVKSGYVEYRSETQPESTIRLWWHEHGQKYREEFIISGRVNSVNISDGKYFYTLNMRTLKGMKIEKSVAKEVQEYYDGFHYKNMRGSEMVLGYECEITEKMGILTSSYKGVPLRIREGSGVIVEEAIIFERDVVMDPVMLYIPGNVRIEDATEDMKSEMMPKFNEEEMLDFDFPPISYLQFIEACTNICLDRNYPDISANSNENMYMVWCANDQHVKHGNINFHLVVLSDYLSIPDWTFGDGGEIFFHNNRKMAYDAYIDYDEEKGTSHSASFLSVKMFDQNILLNIHAQPEMSKEKMIEIFISMGF